jgi:hypothetical protein
LNAWWFSANGQENADAVRVDVRQRVHGWQRLARHMNMNGTDYLIQQNWVRGGTEHCALHL